MRYRGLVIRNLLVKNSSWYKRVTHWKESFYFMNCEVDVISAYSRAKDQSSSEVEGFSVLLSSMLPSILAYFLSPFALAIYIYRKRPDFVLLCNGGYWEFFTIPFICQFLGIPYIVDMVDTIGRKYKKVKSPWDYLVIINKMLFDRFIVKRAYEIFVISSSLEHHYKSLLPEKRVTRSVPSTVNIEQFIRSAAQPISVLNNDIYSIFEDKTVFKVFYAGTINRINGIDFFFAALASVIDEIKQSVVLIFAIIEGDEKTLVDCIKKHGFDDNIFFIIPPVDQKNLPMLLSRADLLFIPEQGIEVANAGFPGKTSEYLLSGKPVLATDFSDLGTYLKDRDNACISKIADFDSYRANLKKLLTDQDFRNIIGENGRKTAINNFSHKFCAKVFIKSIESYYSRQ